MTTKEEQEMAERLREAYSRGSRESSIDQLPSKPWRAGYLAEARLVLADRAALVERAERAEEAFNAEVADRREWARKCVEATADRDRLAAELEAVRGSGGVLTREECAALLGSRSGLVYGDESPAVMANQKTPAEAAAEACIADLTNRAGDVVGAYAGGHEAVLAAWTTIIAQATLDAVAKAHAEGIAAGLRMAAAEATARSHSHAGHLAMATTEVGHAHYSGCEMAESFLAAWCEAKAKEVER